MRPLSSAMSMNWAGWSSSPLVLRTRARASAPVTAPSERRTTGWKWTSIRSSMMAARSSCSTECRRTAWARRWSPNSSARSLPCSLARYMAVSASLSRSAGVSDPWATAIPTLADTTVESVPSCIGLARAVRTRSAAARASVVLTMSLMTTTNSSPPSLATMSPGRMVRCSLLAASRSRSSPAPWPRESFTTLNLSRSRKSTPTSLSCRADLWRASWRRSRRRARFGSPVSSSWKARSSSCAATSTRSVTSRAFTTTPATAGLPSRLVATISMWRQSPSAWATRASKAGDMPGRATTSTANSTSSSRSSGWTRSATDTPSMAWASRPRMRATAGLA